MLFKKKCKTEVIFEVELFGAEVLTFNTWDTADEVLSFIQGIRFAHMTSGFETFES